MMYTKYTDEMWRSAKTAKEAKYWGRQKELEMKCYFEEIENEWTLFDVTTDNRLVTRRYFGKEIGEKKMKGTEKQIEYAKNIIKEWHKREAEKKAYFEKKGITEEGKKLMQRASEILNERIAEEDRAWEIIASQYIKKYDWEHIFYALAKEEIK